MPKQTIGPEARIIRDFDLLSQEGQRIVRDIINAKQPAPKTQEARTPRTSKKGLPPTAPKRQEQNAARCTYVFEGGKECGSSEESGIHDKSLGYGGYHPFESTVTAARPVRRRSSRKSDTSKADGASAVSSETGTADVSDVAHAASAGD
jgi:hypothetical protein